MKFFVCLLLLATAIALRADELNWKQLMEEEEWKWPDTNAPTILDSAMAVAGSYRVNLEFEERGHITVSITRHGKLILRLPAHSTSAFVQQGDLLVYADYCPYTCGCTMVGYDLDTGKIIWTTPLEGIGRFSHSIYHNQVLVRRYGEGVIAVLGSESLGKYGDFIEMKTGKVLAHRVYESPEEVMKRWTAEDGGK